MVPDRGPDLVKTDPPDPTICRCPCHESLAILHFADCCTPCRVCRANVRLGHLAAHLIQHLERGEI